MKKALLFVVLIVGLAAFLNGCCKKQACPDCIVNTVPSGSGQGQSAQASFDQSQLGSYSGARAVK